MSFKFSRTLGHSQAVQTSGHQADPCQLTRSPSLSPHSCAAKPDVM